MDYRVVQDINTVCELLDISKAQLAEELDISRITLDNWLSGKADISNIKVDEFYELVFSSGIRLNRIKEQLYREDIDREKEVLLFHGAKTKLTGNLSIEYSRNNNDFGHGFYCGESLEQSAMFVSGFPASSLYIMSFKTNNLRGKVYGVDRDWMLTIAYYRRRLGEFAESSVIKRLIDANSDIDYIVAPIADNRMFEIIDLFIDGEITDEQCRHCLSATNLGNQYVFKTGKALSGIEIKEHCYLSTSEKKYYLTSRQEAVEMNRDKVKLARRQYRNKGKYIEEILK